MSASVDLVKALLAPNIQESCSHAHSELLPLLKLEESSLQRKIECMLLLADTSDVFSESSIKAIKDSFHKIVTIVEENDLKLPEEEFAIQQAIKEIQEEGEVAAPTNVSAGIDASTPRIDPKRRKKEKDDASIIVP